MARHVECGDRCVFTDLVTLAREVEALEVDIAAKHDALVWAEKKCEKLQGWYDATEAEASALVEAANDVAELCGAKDWDCPSRSVRGHDWQWRADVNWLAGQLVRDVKQVCEQRDAALERVAALEAELSRMRPALAWENEIKKPEGTDNDT